MNFFALLAFFSSSISPEIDFDGLALNLEEDMIGAVILGDDVIDATPPALQQMIDVFARVQGPVLAVERVSPDEVSSYGIVAIDEEQSEDRLHRVVDLVEKPEPDVAPSTLGIVGKYIIPRSTFGILPTVGAGHGGEIRLIDALIAQKNDIAIYGCEFEGKRLDTGRPEGYKEAVRVLG